MDTELIWMAGFFDGEGCIQLRKQTTKLNLTLVISQVYREPLELFQNRFGGSISYRVEHNGLFHYRWDVASVKAENALRAIEPYLVLKKNQARIALEFRTLMPKVGSKHTPEEVWLEAFKLRGELQADKYKYRMMEKI